MRLFQARYAPADLFNEAKAFVIGACLLGFLIWGFGFMVVAGEWFAMWQSQTCNAQEPAFRILLTVIAVLIFVNQHDVDLPDAAPPPKRTPKRRGTDRK